MKTETVQRNQLSAYITKYDFDVFGTLTFDEKILRKEIWKQMNEEHEYNGKSMTLRGLVSWKELKREIEIKALKRYWNKLDRKYFGNNSHRNNKRIQRFNVVQIGTNGTNTHIHFAALCPTNNIEKFKGQVRKVWNNEIKTGGLYEVKTIYDKKRLCDYLTHEFWKLGNDTIELQTSVLHTKTKHDNNTQNDRKHYKKLWMKHYKGKW